MDKEQKELEFKKLEIEKAKVLEGILRSLIIAILTTGAGVGAVIYKLYPSNPVLNNLLLVVLASILIVFSILGLYIYFQIRAILKGIKKWKT